MKLKGLQAALDQVTALQETIDEMIDNHDEEKDPTMKRYEMWSAAYMDIDTALSALDSIKRLKPDDF